MQRFNQLPKPYAAIKSNFHIRGVKQYPGDFSPGQYTTYQMGPQYVVYLSYRAETGQWIFTHWFFDKFHTLILQALLWLKLLYLNWRILYLALNLFSKFAPYSDRNSNLAHKAIYECWFALLRLYAPLEPILEKKWRPNDIERVR